MQIKECWGKAIDVRSCSSVRIWGGDFRQLPGKLELDLLTSGCWTAAFAALRKTEGILFYVNSCMSCYRGVYGVVDWMEKGLVSIDATVKYGMEYVAHAVKQNGISSLLFQ